MNEAGFALIFFPILDIVMCLMGMIAGSAVNQGWKYIGWWVGGLFLQSIPFYFIFWNTDSFFSSGHVTFYNHYVLYAPIGWRLWFWSTMLICGLFVFINILFLFMPRIEDEDILKRH